MNRDQVAGRAEQAEGKLKEVTGLALLLGALALAACGDKAGTPTAGQQLDSAIAQTQRAGADMKAKADQMASEAKAKTESAAAGVSAAVDDAAITATVATGLAKDPDLSALKIDVDTKGGVVSLSGPAPNAQAKARAEEIAKSVKGVAAVDNKLEVKPM
jgi:osmotically-inducible protein OsmY